MDVHAGAATVIYDWLLISNHHLILMNKRMREIRPKTDFEYIAAASTTMYETRRDVRMGALQLVCCHERAR